MADDGGGGSAEWLPLFDRVEAQVEALAADRARLEAADRVQRVSWEAARTLQRSVEELQAAARDKDAEIERLRAEAADARKKLQADASRRGRWEAAYVELLLGANQKLAELRDSDLEDSRTLAGNSSSKEVESCTKLNQNTTDQTASDLRVELRKLKKAYETLSSKKDKELSALLSEKDSLRDQLSMLQQDYAELLKNKKVEAEQASEAAQKLQRNIDELKVLAQKKDHEISILGAEAVGAKKNLQKMHSLVKEKDDEIQRLKGRHPESVPKHNKDIIKTYKRLRSGDPAVTVRDKPENSGIIQTIDADFISETRTTENDVQDESTHKRRRASSMSNDDEMGGCDENDDEQIGGDEDGDKQSGSAEDGDKQNGNAEDGDEHIGSDEAGDKQSGSDEDVGEQSRSDGEDVGEQSRSGDDDDDDDGQNTSDEHRQSGSDEETTHNPIQRPLWNRKRKGDTYNNEDKGDVMTWSRSWKAPAPLRSRKRDVTSGRCSYARTGHWGQYVKAVNDSLVDQPDKHKKFVVFLRNFENQSAREVAITMAALLKGQPKLIHQLNRFLPNNRQIEVKTQMTPCRM
ncbi:protein starmaker-like isoform X3 [Lolium rigidum]|uniref:protein starmaker-like isoform X3 n=1 Tax=Lolium rigidum TaxID=89674 RepID=UPI001F5DD152|nr:protein starmaker-like isoform X3 [Lolium rigidum]